MTLYDALKSYQSKAKSEDAAFFSQYDQSRINQPDYLRQLYANNPQIQADPRAAGAIQRRILTLGGDPNVQTIQVPGGTALYRPDASYQVGIDVKGRSVYGSPGQLPGSAGDAPLRFNGQEVEGPPAASPESPESTGDKRYEVGSDYRVPAEPSGNGVPWILILGGVVAVLLLRKS